MRKDRAALVQATLRSIKELYRSRRGGSPREWLEVDLTMAQLKLLFFLDTDGPTRVTDIAASLGVTLPTITALLGRLEERGLALRGADVHDRRVVLCRLTDSGFRLTRSLWQVGQERFRALLESLSDDELHQVEQALRILQQAARAPAQARAPAS